MYKIDSAGIYREHRGILGYKSNGELEAGNLEKRYCVEWAAENAEEQLADLLESERSGAVHRYKKKLEDAVALLRDYQL